MEPALQRSHEDHITAKGENPMNHYISYTHAEAMENPDAKAAAEKECEAWKLDKVKGKK